MLIGALWRLERNRTVKDYLDLLDEGTGLLLVGGQAVNLWAERYRDKDASIINYLPFTSGDADFYRRAPRLKLLIPVTRCFFDDLLTQHASSERSTQAIAWLSQHAKNVKEAIQLGHHEKANWNKFFPIEMMAEHPSEAVRNFRKYQLKLKNT